MPNSLTKIHQQKKFTAITGVILAGGKSSRMGKDKALLDFNGKPFIQHIAEALQQVFSKIIIISDHGEDYRFLGLPIYEDIFKDCGPLGGIHAAFTRTWAKRIFIISCDLPLLSAETVRWIIETSCRGDVIVVQSGQYIQPLCGMYSRRCHTLLEKHLKLGQHSVLRFLEDVQMVAILPDLSSAPNVPRVLTNVNTPDDYSRLVRNIESA